jgi:leucyl aminopeptidase
MSIKLSLTAADPLSTAADVVVVGVPEGSSPKSGILAALGKALGPSVAKAVKREEFTGKKDQTLDFATNGAIKPGRVLLIGLGSGPLTEADVRLLAAKGARCALGARASSAAVALPSGVAGAERAGAEGVVLGAYRFSRYLTGDRLPKVELERVTLLVDKVSRDGRDAVALGQRVGEAVCIARDLINEPPNELYPETLARAAVEVAKENGLKCTVLDKAGIVKKGMNLLMAVGQGSSRDPRFVHMTYTPEGGRAKKKLVFVGKASPSTPAASASSPRPTWTR